MRNFESLSLPDFQYKGYQEKPTSFEQTCIRNMHKVWFPKIPFDDVYDLYTESGYTGPVTFNWYSQHVSFSESLPDIGFFDEEHIWDTNLVEAFRSKVGNSKAYKKCLEYGVDVGVFPLVGRQLVFCTGFIPESGSFFAQYYKGEPCIYMLLKDWASLFNNPEFLK